MRLFIFQKYELDLPNRTATFTYQSGEVIACEKYELPEISHDVDKEIIDALTRHAFLIIGISYFNAFPDAEIKIEQFELSTQQADYFNSVYRNGLGEFWFINKLSPDMFKGFPSNTITNETPRAYKSEGLLLLESGGKDSLLSSLLLQKAGKPFTTFFISNDGKYPHMLDTVTGKAPLLLQRRFDREARQKLTDLGGIRGHVPFVAISASMSLLAAVLTGHNIVAVSNESSANEGMAKIGDFTANHAWSKTYTYELLLQDYIHTFVCPDLQFISLVRKFTDLSIAEQFVEQGWEKYGTTFSSCNLANYKQGEQAEELSWCGNCDKCANAWLVFSPFLKPEQLINIFGRNLIQDPAMRQRFLNLLGLGDHKPFECVGSIDELRTAYHLAANQTDYQLSDIEVPVADNYDYHHLDEQQALATELLQ